ncbi:hypothetical protein SASPL_126418 [Salvia splendens]|uniref:Solute carrier family 15 (Peptide/histidine transporter), member 3/4 n=1 Tax=Salvia splendens TaxID=180675 RepID=A0A8X8XIV0_SALSN|nr:hypothetical protein SASPL_126418 [Salvia splendens]
MENGGIELEKKNKSENGDEERKQDDIRDKKKQLGGVRTMPFILANEACDRFATSGFHANMITYLTQVLNLPLVKASNTLANFTGTSNFTPIIGALFADWFAGRYWTITVGSFIYVLGMVAITISATLPQLRPPLCPTQENCIEASNLQLWVLYLSLLLTSLGTGGIRPCVVTFAADQFDMSRAKTESRKWNLFNCWSLGLGIPTIALALCLIVFVLGSRLYKKIKPGGSPFVRAAQVIVAAVRKRKTILPDDPTALYHNKDLDVDISTNGRLLHSDQFKFLDRAAIPFDSDMKDSPGRPNLWRQATVHRVEELKTVVRLLPIWAATILQGASHSHINNFTIQQARMMDRHILPSFKIPPATMLIFSTLTIILVLPVYERVFVPLARCVTGHPAGITCLQRMGIGLGMGILSSLVSGLVEIKRKNVATEHNLLDRPTAIIPISAFWLVPQYCLYGLAEVFSSVGHIEFLYDQSPESMRSTAAALYWIAIAIGNYVSTLMVTLVHRHSGERRNWLSDRNLNRGRLECYHWLVSGVQAVNLVYYVVCACFYKCKSIQELTDKNEGDVECADDHREAEMVRK